MQHTVCYLYTVIALKCRPQSLSYSTFSSLSITKTPNQHFLRRFYCIFLSGQWVIRPKIHLGWSKLGWSKLRVISSDEMYLNDLYVLNGTNQPWVYFEKGGLSSRSDHRYEVICHLPCYRPWLFYRIFRSLKNFHDAWIMTEWWSTQRHYPVF